MSQNIAITTQQLRQRKPDRENFNSVKRMPVCVVLDGLTRHYNIGAIFRLCDGLLIEHLYICNTDFKEYNRRFKQASRGAERWVPWSYHENTMDIINQLKISGYTIASLEQASHSVVPVTPNSSTKTCLVLGSETQGVSQDVLSVSDVIYELPVSGMTNSYNVSTAAAITLFELTKQDHSHDR